ncbi:MAG: hypothetical protein ACYCSO_05805 [Cuniculiplasma sp.]
MNYDKSNVDWALFKINEIFKVIDVSNIVVTANNVVEAKEIHNARNYDRIPIRENGSINKYYDSNLKTTTEMKVSETIESCSGILQTFSYFSRRDFYFVLNENEITHFIHYSDLNDPLVLIGIYTQIAYCETAIRDFARLKKNNSNPENGIEKFLNDINNNITDKKINIKRAKKQFKDKKKNGTETDIFDELYFDEELVLFRELYSSTLNNNQLLKFKGLVNLNETTIGSYKDLRNGIMHSKPQIIKQKSDVGEWLGFLQSCQNIISIIDNKTVF